MKLFPDIKGMDCNETGGMILLEAIPHGRLTACHALYGFKFLCRNLEFDRLPNHGLQNLLKVILK
ncbi:MAG: hypothetical protein R3351_07995 [Nitrospirales bacterium]|nr:hypothetical protein [Nitrospirales bacterium]